MTIALPVANVLAGAAVTDFEATVAWYADLFGRPHDAAPMDGLAEWSFPTGGWLQVFADAERAGHSSVTLIVSDIAAVRASLAASGHTVEWSFDGDVTSGDVIRDPDGNRIVFAASANPDRNPSAAGY